jgi:hypothetical protein
MPRKHHLSIILALWSHALHVVLLNSPLETCADTPLIHPTSSVRIAWTMTHPPLCPPLVNTSPSPIACSISTSARNAHAA